MRTDHDYNSLWTFKECWNTTLKKYGRKYYIILDD